MFLILVQFSVAILAGLGLKAILTESQQKYKMKFLYLAGIISGILIISRVISGNLLKSSVNSGLNLNDLRIEMLHDDMIRVLLILISATICLSPYFRTSSFWGLEENYGIICLLLTFLFLSQFLSNDNLSWKNYHQLFLTAFFSSLCLYFDQKLVIIPLICFFF